MSKLFQITEADLATLESELPRILDRQYGTIDNAQRAKWRQVQRIIMDIRWNYGPPGEVTTIPVDGEPPTGITAP